MKKPEIKNKEELIAAARIAHASPLADFWRKVEEGLSRNAQKPVVEPRKVK
jgi:hypothetical protein